VVASVETDIAPGGAALGAPHNPTFPSGGPSSTDLLNGLLPSVSNGNFLEETSAGTVALTNGSVGTFYGNQTATSDHTAYATGHNGDSVTYALGGAWDLSSIVIYGGWNDGGRDEQHYDVLTSTDGTTFGLLGSIRADGGIQGNAVTPVSNRVAFTEDALANLATGVTHVRVNFLDVENGYTGYTEIDVFGSPVPEPAAAAMASLGLLGALTLRRRK
jgi:hypothetical protein